MHHPEHEALEYDGNNRALAEGEQLPLGVATEDEFLTEARRG